MITITIDDRWHGENNSVLVKDNRINWFILYDMQVMSEVAILLQIEKLIAF